MGRTLLFAIAVLASAGLGTHASGPPSGGQAVAQAAPQTPPQSAAPLVRTAALSGQVVDADSGQAVGGAIVRLQSRLLAAAASAGGRAGGPAMPFGPAQAPPGSLTIVADNDGHFSFLDLPKGPAQLTATASGYLDRAPGAVQRPYQLDDDQHLTGVSLRLMKGASISGAITDEAGEPVVGVAVRVMRRESPQGISRVVFVNGQSSGTDDRGLYRIDGLPPGQVFVVVPQTQTIVPASDMDRIDDMATAMGPMVEALTGGEQTSISPPAIRLGDQAWRPSAFGRGALPPPPVNGRFAAYPTTFYPGVGLLSAAAPITLRSGEERTGVDLQIRPTGIARVGGTLIGPTGPASGVVVHLVPAPGGPDDDALAVASSTTGPDGTFAFLGVSAGQYVAKAAQTARGGMPPNIPDDALQNLPAEMQASIRARMGSGDTLFAREAIAVGERDVSGVALALKPGAKLSGKLVFDGALSLTPEQVQNLQVSLALAGGRSTSRTKVGSDLTFQSASQQAGLYTLDVTGPTGPWILRSAMVGGRDVLDSGLELEGDDLSGAVLTLTDRASSVTGALRAESNTPPPNATVVLVAANYRAVIAAGRTPRQAVSPVPASGAYTVGRLLPGDYYIVAMADDIVPADRDEAFFDAVSRLGAKITVAAGETKALDLTVVRSLR